MLALRSLLRKTPTIQACASFASAPQQDHGRFYELRTYDVKPAKMNECMKLLADRIHLRTAHSDMVGFWTVEMGGLNKVFHIWTYDSFAHRKRVRSALPQDRNWQDTMSTLLPMLDKMNVEIAYLVPWSQLGKTDEEGVYELVSFQMKTGGPALWGEAFKAAITSHARTGYTKLMGVFHTEYGLLNKVHVLWWHKDPDSRAAGRHFAHEDARVVSAVRESARFLVSQENMLLFPATFSPLK
ncbi:protein NipSnap homolog 3A-like [Ambystoma mexicanum]|uniref:protein NipSnap homolog 3A-like n=1 Tax=Ambystoma mexicanum TaxID=8296 RepID=UPI0037E869C3